MTKYNVSVQLELVTDGIKALKIAYVFAPVDSDDSHFDNVMFRKYESETEVQFLKRITQILKHKDTIEGIVKNDIKNNWKIKKEKEELELIKERLQRQIKDLDNIRFQIELED